MTEQELRKKAHRNIVLKRFDGNILPSEKSNSEFARKKDELLAKEVERLKKEETKK